jgi:dipeptidyl aminopeptidase/acylaminoacyl peptidase
MTEPTQGPTAFPFDEKQLMQLGRVVDVAPSPCGTWAAVAVERLNSDGTKYACDLWRVSLTADGSEPTQLTRGDSRDVSPCFRHDGALGFLSNRRTGDKESDGKDEEPKPQVWILPAVGGEPVRLTDEPHGVDSYRFARNAGRMAVIAGVIPDIAFEQQREAAQERSKKGPSARHYRKMPVKFWDHWLPDERRDAFPHFLLFDGDGGNRRDLTPQAKFEHLVMDGAGFDLANDGRQAVVVTAKPGADRIDDTALLVFDLETGSRKTIGEESCTGLDLPLFSPDGKHVACTRQRRSAERAGKMNLVVFDVASGKDRVIADAWDRWPHPAAWSDNGNSIVVTADDEATVGVFAIDVASGKVTRIVDAKAGGTHVAVKPVAGGKRVVGVRSTLLEPPEAWVAELCENSLPLIPARLSGMAEGFGAGIADVERLEVTSTDGKPVQYFLIRPREARGPVPALLWIHGGPIHAWTDLWFFRWNALAAAARGYAVVMPNPRGSTGFGQDFVEGIWGNVWGAQCYEDLMTVADAVAARPDIDAARMAAMGGSFGGYMTNWIGANTGRFRCLVTHASVFSMSGFYGDTDNPAWWLLEIGAAPFRDPVAYDRYSPSLRVHDWKSPTLVIHGEKDYRVGITQGVTLFECLQQQGVDSELLVFPDENHWILKPRNSIVWYQTVFAFLGRHLDQPAGS